MEIGHTNLIICFSDWVEKKGIRWAGKKRKKEKVNIIKSNEYH